MLLIIFLSTNKRVGGVTDLKRSVCHRPVCVRVSVPAGFHSACGCCSGAPWPCSPSGRRWSRDCRNTLTWEPQTLDLWRKTMRTPHNIIFISNNKKTKTKFKLKYGCMLVTCVSPRGLLGLKGGRMKSAGSHGDAERDCLASGPASSLLSLLSAEKNTRAR